MLKVLLDAIKELFAALFAPLGNLLKGLFGGVFTTISQIFNIQADDMKKLALVIVSLVVIGGSVISLFFTMRPPRPEINEGPFQGLGQVIAEETIKVVGSNGDIILLVHDTGDAKVPVLNIQQDAFERTLNKESDLRIIATEKIAPDMEAMIEGISSQVFFEILKKHRDADAIVSFVGVPMFSREDLASIPKRRPKIIAGAVYMPGLRDLLRSGLVQVAITPRYETPEQTDGEPQTPREWFDRYYTVVDKDNAGNLPEYM